jgi:hypothetical protein
MAKSEQFINDMWTKAQEYIEECLENTKTHVAGSGKQVEVLDRHIPTVQYFLQIWLPKHLGETISRETYYNWLRRTV